MAIQIDFEIEGEKQISRRLNIVADGITDFKAPLQLSASEFIRAFKQNFSSNGGMLGEPWPARKPQFKSGVRVDTWALLRKTTRMYNSFRGQVSASELEIINTAAQFKYHQSNQPRSKIPRRVMMKLDEARKRIVIKALQAYIIKITRGA